LGEFFVHPIFLEIGNFSIRWFGVMMAIGFLVAFLNLKYQAKYCKIDQQIVSDMLIWILVGGIVGARTAYVIANWATEFSAHPLSMFFVHKGGLIYYGGLIGGIISSFIYVRLKKQPALPIADIAATSLPIGQAFGRIGCFMNGCCYGKVTDSAIGVEYPVNSSPWIEQVNEHLILNHSKCSLSMHPVQFYESFGSIVIFFCLVFILRKQKFSGVTASCYLMFYGLLRFAMEFFRGDPRQQVTSINTAQVISLAMIGLGVALFGLSFLVMKKSNSSDKKLA
jgi:phosphatidylglycerol:prolipoprotein diacylglycerol transferase